MKKKELKMGLKKYYIKGLTLLQFMSLLFVSALFIVLIYEKFIR